MTDENIQDDKDKSEELKEKASNILLRAIEAGNRKYHFTFDVHGWVIAIVALILLALIFK